MSENIKDITMWSYKVKCGSTKLMFWFNGGFNDLVMLNAIFCEKNYINSRLRDDDGNDYSNTTIWTKPIKVLNS